MPGEEANGRSRSDRICRSVPGGGPTAYSVSPGRVNTNIFSSVPWPLDQALKPLASFAFKTPEQGAAPVLFACLAKELEGRSVVYMHDFREAPVNPQVGAIRRTRFTDRLSCFRASRIYPFAYVAAGCATQSRLLPSAGA